jgi:hypothetical protein
MHLHDLAIVRGRLERCAEHGSRDRIHAAVLNDPISEAEVAAFEAIHRVSLPADYRFFLLNVGNGGAGPDYGIAKLGTWDSGTPEKVKPWSDDDWLVGKLAMPFPHVVAWNPVPFDPEKDDPEDDVLDQIETDYLALEHVNGAMPICDHGCNIATWLVVAGPEYGHLWLDRRVDWRGLSPVQQPGSERVTFSQWYLAWLAKLESQLGITPPT